MITWSLWIVLVSWSIHAIVSTTVILSNQVDGVIDEAYAKLSAMTWVVYIPSPVILLDYLI